jgi:outer membrane phospholipase A
MYSQIVENPSYEPKSNICAIEEKFRYRISYGIVLFLCQEEGYGDEVGYL